MVVLYPDKRHVLVPDSQGSLGQPFSLDEGLRIAQQAGLASTDATVRAYVAKTVVFDPLVAETTYALATGVVVQAPPDFEQAPLLATAFILNDTITSTWGMRFEPFMESHSGDLCVAVDLAWRVWDELIAPHLTSPGVHAVRFHTRTLSTGRHVTINRKGQPSRKFLALDLARVERLARQFEAARPADVAAWRSFAAVRLA